MNVRVELAGETNHQLSLNCQRVKNGIVTLKQGDKIEGLTDTI